MGLYGGQQDEDLEEDQEEVKLEEETYVNLSKAPRVRSRSVQLSKIRRRYFLQVELNARTKKAQFRGDPWAYISEEDWRRYFLQFL